MGRLAALDESEAGCNAAGAQQACCRSTHTHTHTHAHAITVTVTVTLVVINADGLARTDIRRATTGGTGRRAKRRSQPCCCT